MILLKRPDDGAGGQVAGDGAPGAAAVGAFEQIGAEVARLVRVRDGEDRVGVMLRGLDIVDERERRHTGKAFDSPPLLPAVFTDLNQPVIGPDIEQPLDDGRF